MSTLLYWAPLWIPLLLVPVLIIVVRMLIYGYRLLLVKKYGYEASELPDPLEALGLDLRRNYQNTHGIRQLKKAQDKFAKRPETPHVEKKHGMWIRSPAVVEIQRQYKRNFSSEAIRAWYTTSFWARAWLVFQVACVVLSIINYVLLTYHTLPSETKIGTLPYSVAIADIFFGVVFLADYLLAFYAAEDRLRYYFTWGSLFDLLTIIPALVWIVAPSTEESLWYLGIWRVLKSGRILRMYKILSFDHSEATRELAILGLMGGIFLFFSASAINAIEILAVNMGDDVKPSLTKWHDSLYFIIVTFSTIGFGDLTAASPYSRAVVMILVLMIVVMVPVQSSRVSEIYNNTSSYQRARFSRTSAAHVILAGPMEVQTIWHFVAEFLRLHRTGHVVLLMPDPPQGSARQLIRHTQYQNQVTYLQGSPSSAIDLKRAGAQFATALFLLTDLESSDVAQGGDSTVLMHALVAKQQFPGLPVFGQVSDIRSLDLARSCGIDRIICRDLLRSTILARNCVVPGLIPLLFNLVHTYTQRLTSAYATSLANILTAFKVPPALLGMQWIDVVWEIMNTHGAILFAVSRTGSIIVNPIEWVMQEGDVGYLITRDDNIALFLQVMYKANVTVPSIKVPAPVNRSALGLHVNVTRSKAELNRSTDIEEEVDKHEDKFTIEENEVQKLAAVESDESSPITRQTSRAETTKDETMKVGLKNHVILTGQMSARGVRCFAHTLEQSNGTRMLYLTDKLPDLGEPIWKDVLSVGNVSIMEGTPLKRSCLEQAAVDKCKQIIFFGTNDQNHDAHTIFSIKMLQEEWPNVRFTAVLTDGTNISHLSPKPWDDAKLRMQSVLNNNILSVTDRLELYKNLRRADSSKFDEGVLRNLNTFLRGEADDSPAASKKPKFDPTYQELEDDAAKAQTASTESQLKQAYMKKVTATAESSEFNLAEKYVHDEFFAAGQLSTPDFQHAVLCQTYFRPYVLDIIVLLSSAISLVEVPFEVVKRPYREVFRHLIELGQVCIGVYRYGARKTKSTKPLEVVVGGVKLSIEPEHEPKPHVITNPLVSDIIEADDLLYVCRCTT